MCSVSMLFDSFLFENMKSKQTKVEIITGLSDQMKNVVKKVLEDYIKNFRITNKFITLWLKDGKPFSQSRKKFVLLNYY